MQRRTRVREPATQVAWAVAAMLNGVSFGCGSSTGAVDAGALGTADATSSAAVDTSLQDLCMGSASGALIDDMSGAGISLAPPPCGLPGAWYVGRGGSATNLGTITKPAGDPDQLWQCGSICQSLYSPLPEGFPEPIPTGADGGATAPLAMCMAGQTGGTQYDWAAMLLLLAAANSQYMMPGFIDASAYQGIEFWLWVSPATAASSSSYLRVEVADRNQTPGAGVCNALDTTATACGGASAGVAGSAVAADQGAGPLLASNGRALSALDAGWQHVRAPWSSFLTNPHYGFANEPALDPHTLAMFAFVIQQVTAGGAPVPFDFCVYRLGFMP
jgi:hypothetical protein